MTPMIGLVDCNNFFVSCERVFRADLVDRPVVVLSNNDGCAVAMSNEAKALGIQRGTPYFKFRELAIANSVYVLSGNHRLYGKMSDRVMAVLRDVCTGVEIYSIDEAFITFPEMDCYAEFGRALARRVRRWTGIPVSIGIAPTKTLAKIAARFAKKYPGYKSACVMQSPEAIRTALSLTDVADVWGIGRRLSAKLRAIGVNTALDLANLPREAAKTIFNATAMCTWRELNGEQCIIDDTHHADRKSITCSRSYSRRVFDKDLLKERIAQYATTVTRRLRRQDGYAREISVFIASGRFEEHYPQHSGITLRTFPEETNDTTVITRAALDAVDELFRQGVAYKRAGITITRIVSQAEVNRTLFTDIAALSRRTRLMSALDHIRRLPADGDLNAPTIDIDSITIQLPPPL